ncbi:MAG: hypothetical protein ACPLZ9_03940 [Candidatus Ratteibacteria bacterium]
MKNIENILNLFYDITKYSILNFGKKREDVLSYILKKTINFTKAKAGNIRLYDPKTKNLVLIASYGTSRKYRIEKKKIKIGESIAGIVIKKKEPIFLK